MKWNAVSRGRTFARRILAFIAGHPKSSGLLVVAVALLAVVAVGARRPGPGAVVLETARVERGDLEREILATGVIKPEEGAVVKTGTRFTGVISRLYVRLGDAVTKGQLIAELDDREQRFECMKLTATVQKLRQELVLSERNYPLQIAEAGESLAVAQADKEYADITFSRTAPLAEMGGVAEADMDSVRQQSKVAAHTLALRRTSKARLETEYTLKIPYLKDAIAEAEAELGQCQTQLSYARIISPMSGVVSAITAQEGETVVAGLQVVNLITVLDPNRLELQIFIDENDIGAVRPGAMVRFTVEAYPDRTFEGTVALIHPGPELRDNIVYYRALVRPAEKDVQLLRPEMTARCRVAVDRREQVLLVPNAAFKWVGNVHAVFVRNGADVRPVRPVTGLVGTTATEVVSGLEEGDLVVTNLQLPAELPREWAAVLRPDVTGG